ncbi:MAG: hypothetical protein F6K19_23620 [Cyanothece sp. SIO1E1]|nr:hypothetical protein [Cyanothece sp. SIO1E1]
MSTHIVLVEPRLAQASPQPQPSSASDSIPKSTLASGVLLALLIVLGIFSKMGMDKLRKRLRFEEFKNRELRKKLKLAVQTITKMERNPDLIHSRDFNLDYLRMRMDEEVFNFCILNQMKVKVKEQISLALRSSQPSQGMVGIASTGREVEAVFDVEYEPGDMPKGKTRILFRVKIKLMKLPTQPTSVTISQIINCIETFLSPSADYTTWQPTIQGHIASMHWDQKAKPTPLLILEQSKDGVNVTFRTTRMAGKQ